MAIDFLGSGWRFPIGLEGGEVARASEEESIQQSIWLILGTSRGERVMRPDFGCGLSDLVFSVSNAATLGRVKEEVRRSLVTWEPRIELREVEVQAKPGEPAVLLIRIEYRVRLTNNVFNLVYPFYLERSIA